MAIKANRVAVVGAGPAGAIAIEALAKEQAFGTIRVFERKALTGGTWVYTPELPPKISSLRDLLDRKADVPVPIPSSFPAETPKTEQVNSHQRRFTDTAVWSHLHSNIPPGVMSYTQEPFPEIVSEQTLERFGPNAPFRSREVIRDWVESLFDKTGHKKLVEFNTTVELAEKRGDEWIITLRKEVPGKTKDFWWQETFDALVVASGHYYVPFVPKLPGLIEFEERFPGKILHSKHYRNPEDFRNKRVVVVGGSVSAFDILHDIRSVVQKPLYSSIRNPHPSFGWTPFTHPHISIKKEIMRLDPESGRIDFADGTSVAEIDHIIFATGYDFSLPFLPQVQIPNRRITGLYLHVFNISDPTLAYIGAVTGGFTFRAFEYQAVAVARVLAGRANLPSKDKMLQWERDRLAERGEGKPFYTLAPDWEDYFEALRAIAGDPAPGTTGRVLPKFDKQWLKAFEEVLGIRLDWWKREAKKAEQESGEIVKARL